MTRLDFIARVRQLAEPAIELVLRVERCIAHLSEYGYWNTVWLLWSGVKTSMVHDSSANSDRAGPLSRFCQANHHS